MGRVKVFKAKKVTPGKASGPVLVSRERLGFKGFVNLEQGIFMGGLGQLDGASLAGTVLVFPTSKGSTLWPITFDLACRFGHAPAAIINSKVDPFVTLSCVLQDIPLVQVEDLSVFDQVNNGDTVTVDADKEEITIGQSS